MEATPENVVTSLNALWDMSLIGYIVLLICIMIAFVWLWILHQRLNTVLRISKATTPPAT
jgi:hypothetical protein